MAYHINQIVINPEEPQDGYFFDDMLGELQPRQPQIEVLARAGHPGETLRDLGVRAEPSRIVTIVGLPDREVHVTGMALYTALVGGRYEIIKHSQSYGYFKILRLRVLSLEPVGASTGYLIGHNAPTVRQVLEWEVLNTTEL